MIVRTVVAATVVLGLILQPLTASAQTMSALPTPGGQFQIGTTTWHLIDADRMDPLVGATPRELMVSVFYPATDTAGRPSAPLLSTQVLPHLEQALGVQIPVLQSHSVSDAPVASGRFPVIVYSPGRAMPRTLATGAAEELASRGYIVVSIDHTYESLCVEFPDGRLVQNTPIPASDTTQQLYLDTRLADSKFVLDTLDTVRDGNDPDAEKHPLPTGLGEALDLTRIGMFGQSLGGYTAVEMLRTDPRISAVVDLDGGINIGDTLGTAAQTGISKPILLITSSDGLEDQQATPSWTALFDHSTGWKHELTVQNSAHNDFTDLPVLLPGPIPMPTGHYFIGPIAGPRIDTITRTYLAAFFDHFLRDTPNTLLDHLTDFPEVQTLR
ncbi:alpha/beta hydrolase family protein [Nocardia sp. NPDC101769]|uniref:alpha/beta hydrolase family protein n=1 Tax=Nocardia sp. NPDC101769 TaxID=3364333 RepID=UPI0037F435A3